MKDVPEYNDITPYEAPEEADIMYEDLDGSLERILRDKAFKAFPGWPESRPDDPVSSMHKLRGVALLTETRQLSIILKLRQLSIVAAHHSS